uniref:Uncharacterized protein n=1 Tax=Anguilla anguilla TaxID=7936 RepID=A0A0E9QDS3_ANGAN
MWTLSEGVDIYFQSNINTYNPIFYCGRVMGGCCTLNQPNQKHRHNAHLMEYIHMYVSMYVCMYVCICTF